MVAGRTTYKSKVAGLEDNTFDVGAASDPAKFSKSLKSIENYIQKTYRSPDDMDKTLQHMKKVTLSYLTKPKKQDPQCCDKDGNPDEDMFEMALFAWKDDYNSMNSRMDKYRDNELNAWALIYNQCLPKLKNKLDTTDGYSGVKRTNNVAKLLTMIQGYYCQFDTLNNKYRAILAAIKNLFYFFQKGDQANADYHKEFIAMMEVIEEYGGAGSLTHFPKLKQELEATGLDLSTATAEELKEGKKTVRKKFLAALMPNGVNGTKYNDLKRSMKETFVTGTSTYPGSPEAVLRILNAYQPCTGWGKCRQDAGAGTEKGAMFAQTEGDNLWRTRVNCHNCGKKGHIARECPERKQAGNQEHIHANIQEDGCNEDDIDKGRTYLCKREIKRSSTRIGSYWTVRARWIKSPIQRC
jgi:hypothetical protein